MDEHIQVKTNTLVNTFCKQFKIKDVVKVYKLYTNSLQEHASLSNASIIDQAFCQKLLVWLTDCPG